MSVRLKQERERWTYELLWIKVLLGGSDAITHFMKIIEKGKLKPSIFAYVVLVFGISMLISMVDQPETNGPLQKFRWHDVNVTKVC